MHLHHTWHPDRQQWRCIESVRAMWYANTLQHGWSDIAQHLTIAPDGVLWTGRDWNRPPCSVPGENGTRGCGPFMIVLVGNFNDEGEALAGPQREVTIQVVARLQAKFSFGEAALRFHRDMDRAGRRTCPGTRIDRDDFRRAVTARRTVSAPRPTLDQPAAKPDGPRPFGDDAELWYQFISTCNHYRHLLRDEPANVPEDTADMLLRESPGNGGTTS